jgi:hypothetical protein
MSLDCPSGSDRGDDESINGTVSPPMASVPIQVSVDKPGGDELNPAVYTDAAGFFSFEIDADKAGDWTVHASVLGSPAAAECDFEVDAPNRDGKNDGKKDDGKGGGEKPPT